MVRNLVKTEDYGTSKLIIERFMTDELVELKVGQTLKHGEIIMQDLTTGKWEKISERPYDGNENFRIYVGEDLTKPSEENDKVQVLRQGRVDKNSLVGLTTQADKIYTLINGLEKHNIFVEEVR